MEEIIRRFQLASILLATSCAFAPRVPEKEVRAAEVMAIDGNCAPDFAPANDACRTSTGAEPALCGPEGLLQAVQFRSDQLCAWVFPLIAQYLPVPVTLPRVAFFVGEASPDSKRFERYHSVDISDFRNTGTELLWIEVTRNLYRSALSVQLSNGEMAESSQTVDSMAALVDRILSKVLLEGMATFVAAQGRSLSGMRPDVRDEGAAAQRFNKIASALRGGRGESSNALQRRWQALVVADREFDIFSACGAFMADVIQRRSGRAHLIGVVGAGPRAFLDAYSDSRPGAMLTFDLPGARIETLSH